MTATCAPDPWTACSCGPLDAENGSPTMWAVACEHMTDRIVVWRGFRTPTATPASDTKAPTA